MSEVVAWVFDSGMNFAPHLSGALALGFLFCRLAGWRGLAWACLGLAGLVLVPVFASLEHSAAVVSCGAPADRLRLASFNLLYTNRQFDRVLAGLEALEPNIIIVQEANAAWPDQLSRLAVRYPYRRGDAGWGAVLILSDRPFLDADEKVAGLPPRQHVSARLRFGEGILRILGVHLVKPSSPALHVRRNEELGALAEAIAETSDPVVVAGDFNASPLSVELRRFLRAAGLTRPRARSALATWPAALPMIGLQIDHVLVTPPLAVERLEAGPDLGSNHLPLIADLALPAGGGCRHP